MKNKMGDLNRGKSLVKFISEGHTLEEASKKFQLSKSDIRADLNCVRCAAFSRSIKNYEKWQKDYISVNKMLSKKSSK